VTAMFLGLMYCRIDPEIWPGPVTSEPPVDHQSASVFHLGRPNFFRAHARCRRARILLESMVNP
jgi:hypothetical protein